MRKRFYALCALIAIVMGVSVDSNACTNVIVTTGASVDGSSMVTYSADSNMLYGELYFKPAAKWPANALLDVYNWDEGFYHGKIAQVPTTYQTVGNMNQHQLIITETTFGGLELSNKDGIIDYGSLIYITLQRAKTAREAISVIDNLLQTYGYASSGESFSIADTKEAWIMELIGKGDEKGAVWVARRIPDGYISAHANQARIHKFPLNDPENCLYAKDVISFARAKGLYSGNDEDFSFCDTYNPLDFGGLRGCEARVWSAFNILGNGTFTWEDESGSHSVPANDFLDFAMGSNWDHKMPLYIKPAQKVTVDALANVMRDHYEGTPMDMTQDIGAGDCERPYRWRPMRFQYDGNTYVNERAIATQQTGFWILGQARGWLPDEVGGLLWFGVDDAGTSPLTPVYTNVSSVPECFREGNGSLVEYSPTAAYWLVSKVTHFAYLFYNRVAPEILKEIGTHQSDCAQMVADADKEAVALINKGKKSAAIQLLTNTTQLMADNMFFRWQLLENNLLVKYLDGYVKQMNEDGSYKIHTEGTSIPEVKSLPYRERWIKAVVNDNGEVLKSTEK